MVELCVNTWKKKRTFLPDLITLRSIRFTIVRFPGTRFSIFSGFLSRIKKIETERERKKERKIHKFASFHRVKIILRYATIDRWRGRKRDERSRSIRCNKCDCSWKKCLRVRNKRVPSTFVRLNRWQSPQCCCLVSGSTEEREFRWVPSSRYYFVLMLGDDHAG